MTADSPLEMIEVTAKRPDSGILFSNYTHKKQIYNMCFWGTFFLLFFFLFF